MNGTQFVELSDILTSLPAEMLCDWTVTFRLDGTPRLSVWTDNPREVRKTLRDIGHGRRWVKSYDDNYAYFKGTTPAGIDIRITSMRGNVCKLVETGETETVEEPDYTNIPKITITRPATKWVCR